MRDMRNDCNTESGKPGVKGHLEDVGVDGKIILERILGKYGGKV
jgi:hypothetical protein